MRHLQDDSDDSDDSDEDEDDEDEEDSSAPTPVHQHGQADVRVLHPSTSAPHLPHLFQHNTHTRTPPALSRQHSATSSLSSPSTPTVPPNGAAVSAATTADADLFNVNTFLPRVTPCPLLDVRVNSVLTAPELQVESLVQLHRHLQDALKALDTALQLDPFEKLLRWVALQASSPPLLPENATPAAAQQATAWALLAHQLELTSSQMSALRQSRVQTERLSSQIASLRGDLLHVSQCVRTYVSQLDGVRQQLQPVAISTRHMGRINQWLQSNEQWVAAQMQMQMRAQRQEGSMIMHMQLPTGADATDAALLQSPLPPLLHAPATQIMQPQLQARNPSPGLYDAAGVQPLDGLSFPSQSLGAPAASSMASPPSGPLLSLSSPVGLSPLLQPSMSPLSSSDAGASLPLPLLPSLAFVSSPPDGLIRLRDGPVDLAAPSLDLSCNARLGQMDATALVTDAELMFDDNGE